MKKQYARMKVALLCGFIVPILSACMALKGTPEWPHDPFLVLSQRHTRMVSYKVAFREYKRDRGMRLYSDRGSDGALQILEELGYIMKCTLQPPFDESIEEIGYLYLNPLPQTEVSPGTIVLVERYYYPDTNELLVLVDSGLIIVLRGCNKNPEELLGYNIFPVLPIIYFPAEYLDL